MATEEEVSELYAEYRSFVHGDYFSTFRNGVVLEDGFWYGVHKDHTHQAHRDFDLGGFESLEDLKEEIDKRIKNSLVAVIIELREKIDSLENRLESTEKTVNFNNLDVPPW